MQRLPLRRLVSAAPEPDRVFHHNVWYRGHTNRRYEELLPRLERVDAYLVFVPDLPVVRRLGYRLLGRSLGVRRRLVEAAGHRYRSAFVTELEQIDAFAGPIVVDVDDPYFTPRELELLGRPHVAAVVVTAERAAERYRGLGLEKPFHVVPQGASLSSLDAAVVAEVARRHRRDGDLVVGYMAAWLLAGNDRGGDNMLFNVDHLLELWEEIHGRVPQARLWLLGGARGRLRERLAGRDDVVLFGRIPPERLLAHVANFDIALYPRTVDEGIRRAKIGEYLGAGVPTVSYDHEAIADVREAGAGILVDSPPEFVDAVVRLAEDEPERRRLADAARTAGRARDWDVLALDYAEILDRHLPLR